MTGPPAPLPVRLRGLAGLGPTVPGRSSRCHCGGAGGAAALTSRQGGPAGASRLPGSRSGHGEPALPACLPRGSSGRGPTAPTPHAAAHSCGWEPEPLTASSILAAAAILGRAHGRPSGTRGAGQDPPGGTGGSGQNPSDGTGGARAGPTRCPAAPAVTGTQPAPGGLRLISPLWAQGPLPQQQAAPSSPACSGNTRAALGTLWNSASGGNTRAVLGTLRNFNVRPPGTPESGHRRRWDSGISGQAPEHFGCVRNAGQQFRRRPINSYWPRRAGLGWKCGWAASLPESDGAAGQRRRQNGGA